MKKISGIIPALITPFNKGGNVDFDSLGQLVEKTLAGGASGFYVTGTSGEAFLLSDAERRDILRFVARVNNGRAVLIAHVGAMSTGKACAFARIAAEAGYDCVSSVAPIYNPYTFDEIKKYYLDIADASGLPMFVYNYPAASGVNFSAANIAELLSDSRFVGVKHTCSDYFMLRKLKTAFPDRILLNGYDETFLAGLAMGADGAVGTTFNFMPEKMRSVFDLFGQSRIAEAGEVQKQADVIIAALIEAGVIPGTKAILTAMGINCGDARAPFAPLSKEKRKKLLDTVMPLI